MDITNTAVYEAAFRSLDTNLPYLFTYTDFKGLNIPPTINHLEELFGHLKERINTPRIRKKQEEKSSKIFAEKLWEKRQKKHQEFLIMPWSKSND